MLALNVALPIIPDHSKGVVAAHRQGLLVSLEKVLPPLNQADTVKLSLLLPFVSKVLQNSHDSMPRQQGALRQLVALWTLEQDEAS